jgi:hypothetical protein
MTRKSKINLSSAKEIQEGRRKERNETKRKGRGWKCKKRKEEEK